MLGDQEIYTLNVDTYIDAIREMLEKLPDEEKFSMKNFMDRYPTVKARMKPTMKSYAGTWFKPTSKPSPDFENWHYFPNSKVPTI